MNTLDELIAASTVTFPRPITVSNFENFLRNLSKDGLRINYTVERYQSLDHGKNNDGTRKVQGGITRMNPLVISSFHTEPAHDTSYLGSMHFFTTPGYDLEELNPDELALFKEVKERAATYFAKQNT